MNERQYAAKTWLNRNYALWCEIRQLKARREVLLADINGGVAPYRAKETQNDATKAQARTEDMRLAYSELCDLIDRRINEINREDSDTLKVIDKLPDATERAILIARHINYLPWARVTESLPWARASVFRYYRKALDRVYTLLYAEIDNAYIQIYGGDKTPYIKN